MPDHEASPDRVGLYYDDWTGRYEESFGDTFQACRPADTADLHRYILDSSGIRDGERVLDAGCGVCGPSRYFASHRDIAIDAVTVSAAQVAVANRMNAEAGLRGRVAVHLGDFHKLDELFPDSTFDRALFLESLSHAADPLEPLLSVFKVLKPGGVVYIKDFFQKDYDDPAVQQFVQETIDRVDRAFVLKTPRLDHTIQALEQAGFVAQRVQPVGFENDLAAWRAFNGGHQFDLYAGRDPVEWSEWLELRFQKPIDAVP